MSVYKWSSPGNHGKQLQNQKKKKMHVCTDFFKPFRITHVERGLERAEGHEEIRSQQLALGWQSELAHQHQTEKEV